MGIFKRKESKYYQYDFILNGVREQGTTKHTNKRNAQDWENAYRINIINKGVGILEKPSVQTLRDFAPKFLEVVKTRCKPRSIQSYEYNVKCLLEFEPLAKASLQEIGPELHERYISYRSNKGNERVEGRKLSGSTINRATTTLLALLSQAKKYERIQFVPTLRKLSERRREYVLTQEAEARYLETASRIPILKDVAVFLLDTSWRCGEVLALKWSEVDFEGSEPFPRGSVRLLEGKSAYSKRVTSMTSRVREMLLHRRYKATGSDLVFPNSEGKATSVSTIDSWHAEVRSLLEMSGEFVIHSLRHTSLTRVGDCGAAPYAVKRFGGHSSISISERYVHTGEKAMSDIGELLEEFNQRGKQTAPAFSTTVANGLLVSR